MTHPLLADVHSHSFFDFWHEGLIQSGQARNGMALVAGAPMPGWTVENTLRMMDAEGIAMSILSVPGGSPLLRGPKAPSFARKANEAFARIISQNPGRFGAFGVVPQNDHDAAITETVYALDELKLDGIGTSSHINGTYLGDASLDPWFAELDRRGAPLFLHPGPSPWFGQSGMGLHASLLEFMFDTTRALTNLVFSGQKQRFPGIKIISTHGGGTIPYLVPRLELLEPVSGAGEGRAMLSAKEVRDGFASFYYDLTAATSKAQLGALLELVPPSQLLMGFDYPMMPTEYIRPAIDNMLRSERITDTTRTAIFHGNALKLFPRLQKHLASR